MKTGRQKCRKVCEKLLRTFIFSKEMHAENHFERDDWDEMAFFEQRKWCSSRTCMKTIEICRVFVPSGCLGCPRDVSLSLIHI